jgi:hypothetical protein
VTHVRSSIVLKEIKSEVALPYGQAKPPARRPRRSAKPPLQAVAGTRKAAG